MSIAINKDLFFKAYQFFEKRAVRHTLIWLGLFILFLVVDNNDYGAFFKISYSLISLAFYIIIVYFNLYYLIPNYLTQKTFLVYGALLLLAALLLTPIKALILYFLYSQHPIFQEYVVFNQHLLFLSTFLIAGSSTIAKILNDWLRHQRERKELETQTMQSELRFLKSQINPHFLFNTLNSLYALTLKKSEKAPEIVIKLSEMMRYMLYECNERRVPLRKEVKYLQNYLDLERLRQGQNVDIDLEITGNIKDQQIAPLMFIPFLENSFKHGLNNQLEEGFVKIRLDIGEDGINLNIENSKPDARPRQDLNKPSGGIGLVNVKRRLNLMYPNHYELSIDDNPKTYHVNLALDLDY